jgi:hypothetical protein
MGNLGRAGYGASLDGMVHNDFRQPATELTNMFMFSGRIPTMRATSGRHRIKRSTVFQKPPQLVDLE